MRMVQRNNKDLNSIIRIRRASNLSRRNSMFYESSRFSEAEADTEIPDEISDVTQPLEINRDLNFIQKLKVHVFRRVYVGEIQEEGWNGALPNYAFKCPVHGLQYNYPSGWNKILKCPECYSK